MSRFEKKLLLLFLGLALIQIDCVSAQDFPISTSNTNVGYIDPATIGNRFRLRFDAGYGLFPGDRAEFFYSGSSTGTRASQVDYQEFAAYFEVARSDWFSAFFETPLRFVNPDLAENSAGIADINVGAKVALLTTTSSFTTFQFRTYLPTGDDSRRLGTGNVNIEPGLLQYIRLTDRWLMENELKTWIPLTQNDFAGTVMRYGAGISYNNPSDRNSVAKVAPVLEIVGWSVLDGQATTEVGSIRSAAGDTVVNAKFGLRTSIQSNQFYAGFGQALTSDHWYKEVLRLEYRVQF